jgi:N-acyl-D-amino-acid deacylase
LSTRRLLRGGLVADGIGDEVFRADVLIDDGTIIAVAPDLGQPDAEIIDLAPGSVVCPGFIDAHVHGEGPLLAEGCVPGALAQGVTTLVLGQDGSSWIGGSAETVAYLSSYFGPVNGATLEPGPCRLGDFTTMVAGRLDHNAAVLASQGTIRHNVAGVTDQPLTAAQLSEAQADLEQELAAGAVGLSSGLDYVPSRYAAAEELAGLAWPLGAADRPYVSHLRAYGARVRDGLAELAQVGLTAGIPVHASHLWGAPEDIDAALADAAEHEVAMTFDMYPYVRSSTILAMLVVPAGLQAAGQAETLRRLAEPTVRAALLGNEELQEEALSQVVLAYLPDHLAQHAGKTIVEAAADDGQPAGAWALDLLVSTGLQVGVNVGRPELTDTHLRSIVTNERHCAGSDGIYQGQHPHPRAYGAFGRLVTYYADGSGQTDYQRLVRHLATRAADTYRLHERGRLAPGKAADVVALAPSGLVDRADYATPRELATGVSLVLVNGVPVWKNGKQLRVGHPGAVVSR